MSNIRDLIGWFIKKDNTLNRLGLDEKVKLQKLLYYSQAMHYAVYGTPLFSERIEAWAHGPVVPAAYPAHEYTTLLDDAQKLTNEEIDSRFDDRVKAVLNVVNYVYGTKTGKELEHLSHEEGPWNKVKKQALNRENPEITKEEIRTYYAPLKDVFEAFSSFSFDNRKTIRVNNNNFTYNEDEINLEEQDLLSLWEIGGEACDKSYFIYKNDEGLLEIMN
jgi:uncharacterized phage-associated protein